MLRISSFILVGLELTVKTKRLFPNFFVQASYSPTYSIAIVLSISITIWKANGKQRKLKKSKKTSEWINE